MPAINEQNLSLFKLTTFNVDLSNLLFFILLILGRLQSDNQVTDPSIKSAVTELGIDNLTTQNEFAQGEAALWGNIAGSVSVSV